MTIPTKLTSTKSSNLKDMLFSYKDMFTMKAEANQMPK
jgi:hypothetical protein